MGELKRKVRFDKASIISLNKECNVTKCRNNNWNEQDLFSTEFELSETNNEKNGDCLRSNMLEKWLKLHSLEHKHLTLKCLMSKAHILKPEMNQNGSTFHPCISLDQQILDEFQINLQKTENIFSEKMEELINGPSKYFGHITGESVGLLIDCSAKCKHRNPLVRLLQELVKSQLSTKRKLFLASYSHDVKILWDSPVHVCQSRVDEAVKWIDALEFVDGGDMLSGMKTLFAAEALTTACIVYASKPDSNLDVLQEFVEQKNLLWDFKLHLVSFECSDKLTNEEMKLLAERSSGCYHCYNSHHKSMSYESSDLQLLMNEIRKCGVLFRILRGIRLGWMGSTKVKLNQNEQRRIACFATKKSSTNDPCILPLRLEMPSFKQSTSHDWLMRNGLKAKHLDLYQVLAGNAYAYKEQFVPIIKKKVQSQVHERAMTQFTWKDGSTRNVHVDVPELLEYQRALGRSVGIFQKRLEWLSSDSRKLFGTVAEDNVVLLLDFSGSNESLLPRIQKSLRLLLEDQLANKDLFNVVVCSENIHTWKASMVRPTGENLQEAWRWIMTQECSGRRDFMAGLRRALENEDELKHGIDVQGLYLLTTGMPDHPMDVITSYVEEKCCFGNTKIHVVYLGLQADVVGRNEKTAECFRGLCKAAEGRLHWIRESGIIESDDVRLIEAEINRAIDYSQKCSALLESAKKKAPDLSQSIEVTDPKSLSTAKSLHKRTQDLETAELRRPLSSATNHPPRSASARPEHIGDRKTGKAGKHAKNPKSDASIGDKLLITPAKYLGAQVSSLEWVKNLESISRQHFDSLVDGCSRVRRKKKKRSFADVTAQFCLKRLKWLFSGSRRYFGTILEENCVIMVDTSGSMVDVMMILKEQLLILVQEQLKKHCKKFNFISFSTDVRVWRPTLVEAKKNLKGVHEWIENLKPAGSTCTLQALEVAMEMAGVEGIYVLTDGKPNSSMSLVLERVSRMNSRGRVKINTISFNCFDGLANQFLRELAHNNHGRYHKFDPNVDFEFLLDQIDQSTSLAMKVVMENLEGDDVEVLVAEMTKVRHGEFEAN